jgi:hypothetical protein
MGVRSSLAQDGHFRVRYLIGELDGIPTAVSCTSKETFGSLLERLKKEEVIQQTCTAFYDEELRFKYQTSERIIHLLEKDCRIIAASEQEVYSFTVRM